MIKRKHTSDIAKVIRNLPIGKNHKIIVYRALAAYFEQDNPLFNRQMFVAIASGSEEIDFKTEWKSLIKENEDA